MEHQDEVFESIPWERLGTLDGVGDRRRWIGLGLAAILVGAIAFLVRSVPAADVPVVAPPPVVTVATIPPVTEALLVAEDELWAEAPTGRGGRFAGRFAVELLTGSGLDVAGIGWVEETSMPGISEVVVVIRTEGGFETIAVAVETADDGEVLRWWPAAVEPLDVRVPTPGAEPPPEILAEFTRAAGRWGTTVDVLSSGLADDRWWAEVLVRLPSGTEVPVTVWEGS